MKVKENAPGDLRLERDDSRLSLGTRMNVEAGERSACVRAHNPLMCLSELQCVNNSNQNAYLLVMPLKFTDRWIQFVEGNDLNAQVFAHFPAK